MELLTTPEAAQLLKLKKNTLEIWRFQGTGPDYIKIGRTVRYPVDALKSYLAENTHKTSATA